MSTELLISVFFDIVITAALYLLIPIIVRVKAGRISKGPAKAIAIVNAILIAAFFTALKIYAGTNDFNFSPAVLWGFISYFLIRDKYS